jgi:HK97 family phage portal protein
MGLFSRKTEDRALPAPEVTPALVDGTLGMWPSSRTAPLDVNTSNALRVSDAYACVRCLADSVSSLPLHVFRRTPAGRVPAGADSRAVQLLQRPSPGSTTVDLISQAMVHLQIFGECFVGKYRSDGEIVQLGLLPPDSIQVELHGQRIVYILDTIHGRTEHGPEDILHIKGMSIDGLRGLSPVAQCRVALGLSSSLQVAAKAFTEHGSRPSGILTVPAQASHEVVRDLSLIWHTEHGGADRMGRVPVVSGDVTFTPIAFSADDSQFLQQRELSAREVARIFRCPAWAIDAPTGDSLTYANVAEQNRALIDHSLRPWTVRIERAISNDSDLCPGSTYVEFSLDGLLRGDSSARAEVYTRALDPVTGWLQRSEVRELENLTPEDS